MKSHIIEERCTLTGGNEDSEKKKESCWKQRAEDVSKFADKKDLEEREARGWMEARREARPKEEEEMILSFIYSVSQSCSK